MPHPIFTLFTALLIAMVMAMVEDRTPRERLYVGVRFFACCAMVVLGGGWVMRLIHG